MAWPPTRRPTASAIRTPRDSSACGASASRRGPAGRPGARRGEAMTLWEGRFEGAPAADLLTFTVSLPFDKRLAIDDLVGSRAHVRGLERAKVLTHDEAQTLLAALDHV